MMKSGPSRSIIRGAVLILAVAASACVGEVDDPTVAEALGAASAIEPDACDVAAWARDEGMTEGSLREMFADLADRAAVVGEIDGSGALRERAGWREEPPAAPL